VLLLAGVLRLPAQVVTQTFTLQAGWNAGSTEVVPSDPAPAAVFSNLPVASVWARAEPR
jgi:hypothetical protein